MDIKIEIDKFITKNDNDEDAYLLDELKKSFEFKEFGRNLVIFHNEDDWISFAFFKWQQAECTDVKDVYINAQGELYWYGCGPSGNLRELRHSFFSEYIFYLDTNFLIECSNWLKQYFD